MNMQIVTQNVAPVNWERSTERNHKWHTAKTLEKLSRQDAQRRQRAEELRNDPANAAFLEQGIDPSEIFA